MTQLKCPECGKEFDDTKQACPDCGCPAKECSVVEPVKQAKEKEESPNMQIESKYVKGNLLPEETIVASAEWQIKPILIVIAILFWIGFAILFIIGLDIYLNFVVDYFRLEENVIAWCGLFPLALLCSFFGGRIVSWMMKFREFVITNRRVIAYYGFIRRVAFELRTEKVESIIIYQGLLARLFKCGMVQVRGVGGSKASVHLVKDPFEFRQHFFDLQYAEKQNTLD